LKILKVATAWAVALAWNSLPAAAASLRVAPVSLSLAPGQQAVGLSLSNTSDRALTAQIRVFLWSQDESDDHLTAEQDVVVSPPIARVAPLGEQLVRIVRLSRATPQRELTYRLLVDELPEAPHTDLGAIDIRLRYSIPLFVLSNNLKAAPSLRWELKQRAGTSYLRVVNSGELHAQLSNVEFVNARGPDSLLVSGLLGYSLIGGAREWRLPPDVPLDLSTGVLRIRAVVNGKKVEVNAAAAESGVER
jgi:fimbrial chaperone protein